MRLFSLLLSVAAFWNPSMEPILGRQLPRDSLQQFLQVKFNPRTNISDGFTKYFRKIDIAFWLPKHRNAREVWILLDINGGAPRERLRAFADAAYSDIWRPSLYHSLGWYAGTYMRVQTRGHKIYIWRTSTYHHRLLCDVQKYLARPY